ncbi:hypothetical protein OC834_002692 [Tilletia horrida]|nr:hypothetical protein OC834_002692 [Tilletia horrida]
MASTAAPAIGPPEPKTHHFMLHSSSRNLTAEDTGLNQSEQDARRATSVWSSESHTAHADLDGSSQPHGIKGFFSSLKHSDDKKDGNDEDSKNADDAASTTSSKKSSSSMSSLTNTFKAMGTKMHEKIQHGASRIHDFVHLYKEVTLDLTDASRHPELTRDAYLRRNNALSPEETAFIAARKQHILTSGALKRFLRLPDDEEIHPDDIPVVAVGGSGGGYRACLGYLSLIEVLQDEADGLWDLVFYAAGVSGSCWSLGALYSIAQGNAASLLEHFSHTSADHPLSATAINAVARSPKGIYFQLGPIVQKMRAGSVHWTPLDLYGSLTTSHILLSRCHPHTGKLITPRVSPEQEARAVKEHIVKPGVEVQDDQEPLSELHDVLPALKHEWFKFSNAVKTTGIDRGLAPIPIFTAVRHERPWRDWKSPTDPFDEIDQASEEHERANAWWQTFEINPFDTGCDELEGWIPTWSFGRTFNNGHSDIKHRLPERHLSLLLGIATSAPAGPLSAWLDTLARNLPQNAFGNTIQKWSDSWAKKNPKEAERLRGHHPVHAVNEPNPFFGAEKEIGRGQGFENSPRVHLVDAGMSNNLPTYVFFRPHRNVDVMLLGDYSSDVQKGAALERIHQGGTEKGVDIKPRVELPPLPDLTPPQTEEEKEKGIKPKAPSLTAAELAERFKGRYAQVLDARPVGREQMAEWERAKAAGTLEKWDLDDFKVKEGIIYNEKHVPLPDHPATLVYLPLLPHECQPDYDPATAPFSSSYNLCWTKEQVDTIRRTGKANTHEGLETIRTVVREAYEKKKKARLSGLAVPAAGPPEAPKEPAGAPMPTPVPVPAPAPAA